ncbi:hypothetical protein J4401_04495 [Candidatus Woesearchaeota archaeon]|nr:hypothetical protein [Candidatus Woesearchaeota archaeon]
MNKKALSPLAATVILVVFALVIGAATMSWGKSYVSSIPDEKEPAFKSSFLLSIEQMEKQLKIVGVEQIDNSLKDLQMRYIRDEITLEEYLSQEEAAIKGAKN